MRSLYSLKVKYLKSGSLTKAYTVNKPVVFKLTLASEFPGGLIKIQVANPSPKAPGPIGETWEFPCLTMSDADAAHAGSTL